MMEKTEKTAPSPTTTQAHAQRLSSEEAQNLTPHDWRQRLTPEQFRITQQKGTERPFSGQYHNHKEHGLYACVCCHAPLFASADKFDSGTGWPSFTKPTQQHAIAEKPDHSFFMKRTEILCANCQAHLGHVFNDGPQPTKLRYCINSAALNFEKA